MRDLPALTAMVLCLALAAGSHGAARDVREDRDPAPVSLAPMPEVLRVASLGHGSAAASLLWMHTVARFTAAMYDRDDPDAPTWIADAVRAAGDLDPEWTLPWVYGSMMLDRLDAIGIREELLHAAVEAHPEEPWFPFVLGMSRYRHHDDLAGALAWLERAAAVPGADQAYERALGSMRSRVGPAHDVAPGAAP